MNTHNHALTTPIHVLAKDSLAAWLKQCSPFVSNWVQTNQFKATSKQICIIPSATTGDIEMVLFGWQSGDDIWAFGQLAISLPPGNYTFVDTTITTDCLPLACLAWRLSQYEFTRYKASEKTYPNLVTPDSILDSASIDQHLHAINLVRDLINIPAEDLGPLEFAKIVESTLAEFPAKINHISDNNLQHDYPMVHAVGKASPRSPRILDIHWGDKSHPKLCLVGKGVCFDTGGLDLKPSVAMLNMKKDMAGAAHVLALGYMIMTAKLPISLRVIIPLADNAVSGNAYRPRDILKSHAGLTVEVTNTDAEGRLLLADALSHATDDKPDLLIDFASLTGAARVALGKDIIAMFTNNSNIASALMRCGEHQHEPIWHMPLHKTYKKLLDSDVADLCSTGKDGYAGAITAALFLQEFVKHDTPWVHFDIYGWHDQAAPGKSKGGEAMGLLATFAFLKTWATDKSKQ